MKTVLTGLVAFAFTGMMAFAEGTDAKKDAPKKDAAACEAGAKCDAAKAEKAKKPAPTAEEIAKLQTIKLTTEVKDGVIALTWEPANAEGTGVKVVASEKNTNPVYPQDGYVLWKDGAGQTSATIDNMKAACKTARHVRVCVIDSKDHNKLVAVSNVVEIPAVEANAETLKKLEEKKAEHAAKKAAKEAEKAEKKESKDEKKSDEPKETK